MKDWSINDWQEILEEVLESFCFEKPTKKCIRTHPLSELIIKAPFIAGAENPERWAATNFGTLLNARSNQDIFALKPGDSLKTRLEPVNRCGSKTDSDAFKKTMLLLQLAALQDDFVDLKDDALAGEYNILIKEDTGPMNEAEFEEKKQGYIDEYDRQKEQLTDKINELVDLPETNAVDKIITIDEITVHDPAAWGDGCPWWFC